ncbi:MAG TPA: leucyl aminopeptidase family protein [Xanthobacteraceae bacterium]|jgi:leucyl aminopeptidase|nr:leucyl aminopeptidase family protein [Xanthobacteraceae bacterium]
MPDFSIPFVTPGSASAAVPVTFVTAATWTQARERLDAKSRAFAAAAGFEPRAGRHLLLPGPDGGLSGVLFGLENADDAGKDLLRPGALPTLLPAGTYCFANAPHDARLAALAFALGAYRFARYRKVEDKDIRLELPAGVDGAELTRIAEGVALARDLINTPANDMGPAELESAAHDLATRHRATFRAIVGENLLSENFPLIHAVGRAADRAPRLIDIGWGDPANAKITLIGKGVCFDTGGLDIKTESGMLNMKKDMGGAATVLALGHMLMDRGAKVRLRILLPVVENAISGSAFRPRDIYRSRKGVSVEIGNTDAEGRLILADALALADEEAPELIVDMATLTGAARVALGPEVVPFYTDDDALAAELARSAEAESDPLWRLPLWLPYDTMLDSKVADINNVSAGGFAGSITAALFLRRFVTAAKTWLHCDIYAWNQATKPGRPEGAECQAARALYHLITARYG